MMINFVLIYIKKYGSRLLESVPKGVITAQVKARTKTLQVENWLNIFHHHFGNTKLSRVYIPSFDTPEFFIIYKSLIFSFLNP